MLYIHIYTHTHYYLFLSQGKLRKLSESLHQLCSIRQQADLQCAPEFPQFSTTRSQYPIGEDCNF